MINIKTMKRINLFKIVIILIALSSSTGFTYSLVETGVFKNIGMFYTMISLIGVTSICAVVEAYFDAKKWVGIKHGESAFLRGVFIASTCVVVYQNVIFAIVPVLLLLVVYWAVFDPSINIFKKLPVWRIGTTSKLDKLAGKYIKDGSVYMASKILLANVLFLIYMFA